METRSGFWSGMKSLFRVIVALLGQDLVLICQFLANAVLLRCTLHLIPFVSFARFCSHASIKLSIFVSLSVVRQI